MFSAMAMSMGGASARINELLPGVYTVCVVPYPAEVRGMQGVMEYRGRGGNNLPIFCEPVDVTASPGEQSMSIDVMLPIYVPPPAPQGHPEPS